MTSNQIAYWNLQELKRHNQAMDRESERHNLETEKETGRHNVAGEAETGRHNIMQENLDAQRNLETYRHNVESEYSNLLGAYAARTSASANYLNASTNRSMLPYQQGYVLSQTDVQKAQTGKLNAETDLTKAKIPGQLYANQTSAKELAVWNAKYAQDEEMRSQQIRQNNQKLWQGGYEIVTQPIRDIVSIFTGGAKAAKDVAAIAMQF